MRLFVVEDDLVLAKEIVRLCRHWGFEADYTENFRDITCEYEKRHPDLILMDINLPYYDGFYWCEKIRQLSTVPILFLSSRDQNSDKVMAMALGGDDYMEKPFDSELLLVKIRSMLRRAYEYRGGSRMYLGEEMYLENGSVICGDRSAELTKSEQKIMTVLLEYKGSVVSREKLMTILWNTDEFVTDASLTVLVSRLRTKLRELSGKEDVIWTKKGIGYYIK